jgi:hypothetical protein
MPAPVVAAIIGGLAAGATFSAAGCKVSKKEACSYMLSALVVVLGLFITYLHRKHQLTLRTLTIGWGVICGAFVILAMKLKNATEGSAEFVHVVSILVAIAAGISGFLTLDLVYLAWRTKVNPMTNADDALDLFDRMIKHMS